MPYVKRGRVNQQSGIYFEEMGSGDPVILINGLSRSGRHWLGFGHEMAKKFRVVTIDNRGVGRSGAVRTSFVMSVQDMARDVVDVMNALSLSSAHIIGCSLGGMIGLGVCLLDQTRVRSLTMINSSIGGNLYPRISIKAVVGLLTSAASSRDVYVQAANYLIAGVSEERRNWILEQWRRFDQTEAPSFKVINQQLLAAARFQVKDRLKEIQVPILIYNSRDDVFVPIVNSALLHAHLPSSRLKIVPLGGHEVMVSRPEETAQDIGDFIRGV
jgi:pimeloyl-ACP methyl ester carboxylesterase